MPPALPRRSTPCSVGRHRVYTEEFDYLQGTSDGRIYDRFDVYRDTTVHLVAEVDGCIVGGVRYCLHDPQVGLPVDEFFDFSPTSGRTTARRAAA